MLSLGQEDTSVIKELCSCFGFVFVCLFFWGGRALIFHCEVMFRPCIIFCSDGQ